MDIGEQIELGWHFDPLQPRDAHGHWVPKAANRGNSLLGSPLHDSALATRARVLRARGMGPESIRAQMADENVLRVRGKAAAKAAQLWQRQHDNRRAAGNTWTADAQGNIIRHAHPRPVPAAVHRPTAPGVQIEPGVKQYLLPGMPSPDSGAAGHNSPAARHLASITPADLAQAKTVAQPSQGIQGDTSIIQLASGEKLVHKRYHDSYEDMPDADELAYYVAQAIDAPTPPVSRVTGGDPLEEVMGYVPGTTAMRYIDENGEDAGYELTQTPEGQQIGLLDYLIVNIDRHNENWMVSPEGSPVGIDNSSAFQYPDEFDGNDFWGGGEGQFDPETVAAYEKSLKAIEPEFTRLGRDDWYTMMIDRLYVLSSASDQFAGDAEAIELADASWVHELRGPGGEWVHSPGAVPGTGIHRYVVPDPARLIASRGIKNPADQKFFKAHPVSPANIVSAYDAADPGTRAQGMRWYSDVHQLASQIGQGDAEKGGILLSTYSPQTSWPINMFNATESVRRGRAIGPGEGAMVSGDQQAKAQKALDGAGIDELMKTAKTHSFGVLIKNGDDSPDDPYGHVVIDTHALNVAAGGDIRGDEQKAAPIGDARMHEYVADQYRAAARQISERDGELIKPHQLQAVTWLMQQHANQAHDQWMTEHGTVRERGTAKGRISATRNYWKKWMAYARAQHIPLEPGISSLAAQITEMLAEQSIGGQIELAYNPMQLRDRFGRWTRFGGVGEAADVAMKEREGFSVSPRTGRSPAGGYMVARTGHTHTFPAPILDDHEQLARAIDSMLMAEKPAFAGQHTYLGGWVHDGKLWLEPSDNFPSRDAAISAGQDRNQIAIWDVAGLQEINTGGSGGGRITEHDASGRPVRSYTENPPGSAAGLSRPAGGRAAADSRPAGQPDSIGHQIELAAHRPGRLDHPPAGHLILSETGHL